jgi:hypothetical protein
VAIYYAPHFAESLGRRRIDLGKGFVMSLDAELTDKLRGTYEAARKRGYVATYFLQMLEEHGGVETAKRLLAKSEPQTGLFELWNLGLLQESMEAIVLQGKFKNVFTEVELAEANRRLEELGYFDKRM